MSLSLKGKFAVYFFSHSEDLLSENNRIGVDRHHCFSVYKLIATKGGGNSTSNISLREAFQDALPLAHRRGLRCSAASDLAVGSESETPSICGGYFTPFPPQKRFSVL